MANEANLVAPWPPGTTGNPNGYSEGRRKATRLREALDVMLEDEIPELLLDSIPEEMQAIIPPGITYAEFVAMRVLMVATRSDRPETILGASNLLLNATAKPDHFAPPPQRTPPLLPSTEERRAAIASQLGLGPKKRKPRKKAANKKRKKKAAKRKRK
jgi:hypothetical protein